MLHGSHGSRTLSSLEECNVSASFRACRLHSLAAKLKGKHMLPCLPFIPRPTTHTERWDSWAAKATNGRAGQWRGTLEKEEGNDAGCCPGCHSHQGSSLSQAKRCFFLWKYLVVATSLFFLNYASSFISRQCPTTPSINFTSRASRIFFCHCFHTTLRSPGCSSTPLILDHSDDDTDLEGADAIWMHFDIFWFHFPSNSLAFSCHISFSSLDLPKWGGERQT